MVGNRFLVCRKDGLLNRDLCRVFFLFGLFRARLNCRGRFQFSCLILSFLIFWFSHISFVLGRAD